MCAEHWTVQVLLTVPPIPKTRNSSQVQQLPHLSAGGYQAACLSPTADLMQHVAVQFAIRDTRRAGWIIAVCHYLPGPHASFPAMLGGQLSTGKTSHGRAVDVAAKRLSTDLERRWRARRVPVYASLLCYLRGPISRPTVFLSWPLLR